MTQLLTPEFLHRLDRLDIVSRKMLRGRQQGERRSKKRGQSVEFADYRNYVVGDDLRRIDWNLYARLDKLFLRLFMEEEDLTVNVLLDTTASMRYGDPDKLAYAKQLAAAMGYVALTHFNRLCVYSFDATLSATLEGLRGRRPLPRLLDFLDELEPSNQPGDLGAALRRFALLNRQPGVLIIVSDFMDKGDLGDALRFISGPRFDAYAVQVLSPQEVAPGSGGVAGDLRLTDVEDGDIAEVSANSLLLERYAANLQAYCQHVREQCVKRGLAYFNVTTDVPVETVVLRYFRERGLLG
jgi:uncharacterized protein (DUF58 family)